MLTKPSKAICDLYVHRYLFHSERKYWLTCDI